MHSHAQKSFSKAHPISPSRLLNLVHRALGRICRLSIGFLCPRFQNHEQEDTFQIPTKSLSSHHCCLRPDHSSVIGSEGESGAEMFADGADFPWELLLNVVFYLGFEDFVNLKATRLQLLRALRSEGLCREIVKVAARNPPPLRNQRCLPNLHRDASPTPKRLVSQTRR